MIWIIYSQQLAMLLVVLLKTEERIREDGEGEENNLWTRMREMSKGSFSELLEMSKNFRFIFGGQIILLCNDRIQRPYS